MYRQCGTACCGGVFLVCERCRGERWAVQRGCATQRALSHSAEVPGPDRAKWCGDLLASEPEVKCVIECLQRSNSFQNALLEVKHKDMSPVTE